MKRGTASILGAIVLTLGSPVSLPGQGKAPDWIFNTPKPDTVHTYFVGSASDETGDVVAASNAAIANVYGSIEEYTGYKDYADREDEDRIPIDVKRDVWGEMIAADGYSYGSGIKKRFVQTDNETKRVTVYILAVWENDDLEKEKARFAEINKERIEAVERPGREAAALLEQNRDYEAVRKFVEAAVAVCRSRIDDADFRIFHDIFAAGTALSKIHFDVSGSTGYSGFAGQDFKRPFTAKVVVGEGASARGLPGVVVLLSYRRRSGTRLVSKTESVMTDASGALAFTPPAPDFVGKAKFTLRLDFYSTFDLLDELPEKYGYYRDTLSEELRGKFIEVPYEVVSNARNASMAVAILDLDEQGAIEGALTQAGLVERLLKEGFDVQVVSVPKNSIIGKDDAAVSAAAASAGKFERVAFGTATITSLRQDGSNYLAEGKAVVKVLDIASGHVLYSAEQSAIGLGTDEKSARAAGYRELGLDAVGKDMLYSLP